MWFCPGVLFCFVMSWYGFLDHSNVSVWTVVTQWHREAVNRHRRPILPPPTLLYFLNRYPVESSQFRGGGGCCKDSQWTFVYLNTLHVATPVKHLYPHPHTPRSIHLECWAINRKSLVRMPEPKKWKKSVDVALSKALCSRGAVLLCLTL